jgi:hypothetical protein
MSDKMQSKCLYYPYIEFQSLDLVKSSLLYWEGIYRIVPSKHYDFFDSNEDIELANNNGLIQNIPASEFRDNVSDNFIDRLELLSKGSSDRLKKYDNYYPHLQDTIWYVHVDKISVNLLEELRKRDLIHEGYYSFMEMNPGIAAAYMTTLAGEIAQQLNTPLITDNERINIASLYFNTTEGSYQPTNDGWKLAQLISPFPSPESVHDFSMNDILEIRDSLKGERNQFRRYMQTLIIRLEQAHSDQAVNDIIDDMKNEISEQIQQYEDSMRQHDITLSSKYSRAMITTNVPAMAGGLVFGGPMGMIVAGGLNICINSVEWYGKRREYSHQLRQICPCHYLISLQSELEMHQPNETFLEGMYRFAQYG